MKIGLCIAILGLGSCAPGTKPTIVTAQNGAIAITHDGASKAAPVVESKTDDIVIPLPPTTKITIREYSLPTAVRPKAEEIKSTTIELPKEAGTTVTIKRSEVSATGSVGHEPPPPPTPFERSIGLFGYLGAAMFLGGIFFCTPWGGNNYRVGGLIAAGGLTMALLGVFLNELSQWLKYNMPSWLPAVGLLGLGAAVFLYMGYRQKTSETDRLELEDKNKNDKPST